jgi:hypothetical protein
MSQHSTYNADRLETLRRTRTRTQRWSWLFGVGSVLLLLLLVAAWADYGLELSPISRWIVSGLLLICATIGVGRWITLWRRQGDLKAAALELESRRPDLGCVISTAAEYLEGGRTATRDYEPELVEALQQSAARHLVRVETPWYRRKLLGTAAALGVAGIAVALLMALVPSGSVAVERVLMPWSDTTFTRVEVVPGNVEIPEGTHLDIAGLFSGRSPREPRIEWRLSPDDKWHHAALKGSEDGRYAYSLRNVRGPLYYRLAGGDAVSPQYQIATFIPPEIDQFHITIEYPDYTGLDPSEQTDPNLAVVRASHLTFRITASGDVQQARLRFADQPGLPLQAGPDNSWTASLTAQRDLYYWVDLIDADGRKGGNTQPYRLTVLPDEAPDVAIFNPALDIRADPTDRIPIEISVTDDFGVESLELVFHKVGGEKQVIRRTVQADDRQHATASVEIDLAPLELQDYELVAYYAQARDNNTLDGPGTGQSPVYFIEITNKERALSQCNGRGQRINLLVIQKQIIASTIALEPDAEARLFLDLSTIQRQALEYAAIFKDGFQLALAPPEARAEFASAMKAMDEAATELDERRRGPALEAEQRALAHLYQACRLLPELEAGMCRGEGECIQIVLDAIEKLNEEREREIERNLPEILREARRLAQAQAMLNDIYRQSDEAAASAGSSEFAAIPATQGDNAGRSDANRNAPDQEGDGEPQLDGSNHLSEEQRKLSEAAAALAARLRELSGRNPNLSHEYPTRMREASQQLRLAYLAVVGSGFSAASDHGAHGLSAMADVIARLERLLDQPAPTDPATEDYPRQYEALVAEYFRKLSFEQ